MLEMNRHQAGLHIGRQRLVDHDRPEVGAADADVDDRLDPLAGDADPVARAHLVGEGVDLVEHLVDVGSTSCRRRRGGVAAGRRSAVCSTDRFSVTLIRSPANIASRRSARPTCAAELDEGARMSSVEEVLGQVDVEVGARRRRALVVPAVLVLMGVAVQAILGGITVRTGLNPATVAAHFLASMGLVAAATAAFVESRMPRGHRALVVPPIVRHLAWVTTALAGVVLVLGTIVTGSGPHSGDADEPARLSFDPRSASWLHADSVMLFVGLVVAMVVATHLVGRSAHVRDAWRFVLLVTLAQGAVGYTQYFTKLPEALVLIHMLLATMLVVALVNGLKHLRGQGDAR
jgi:heme A synthase